MKILKNNRLNVMISWVAVVLWMLLIFNLSSQVASASDELSRGVTEIVVKAIKIIYPPADITVDSLNHFIRKNAHFVAYMILGVLVINALKESGVNGYRAGLLSFVICVLYAVSDEIHQGFVPGRGPQVKDVLIDSAGVIVGLVLYVLVIKISKEVMISRRSC